MSQSRITFPTTGSKKDDLLQKMNQYQAKDADWRNGRTFSLVFYGGDDVAEVSSAAFQKFYYENGLNPSVFPSLRRFETEVVSMVLDMMHGDEETVGNMTSGGTESILCAVKAARNWAKKNKPQIKVPELVVPVSVHPAFDKAANYFGLKIVHVPVREDDLRADVAKMKAAINENTVMIVGSAPSYPHGLIDPIEEIAALAVEHDLWMHVDACVGGFMLPWVEKLGYDIPKWDFRVPGVTTISADLHKYGYTAKGTSVVLHRNSTYRKSQYFVYSEWTGGIYASPSVAGTRPGGGIASAWAVLNYLGEDGYLRIAKRVMDATKAIENAVNEIDGIYIVSNPELSLLAIASKEHDIFAIGDELTLKGWHLDRQLEPESLHLTVSQGNADIADEFIADLKEAVATVKKFSIRKVASKATVNIVKGLSKMLSEKQMSNLTAFMTKLGGGGLPKRTAAMYGMMGALPNSGDIDEIVLNLLDGMTKVQETEEVEA